VPRTHCLWNRVTGADISGKVAAVAAAVAATARDVYYVCYRSICGYPAYQVGVIYSVIFGPAIKTSSEGCGGGRYVVWTISKCI